MSKIPVSQTHGSGKALLGQVLQWGVARPFSGQSANVVIVCGKCPHSFPSLDVYRPETVPADVREACLPVQLRYYNPASLINCVSNKRTELPECCSFCI